LNDALPDKLELPAYVIVNVVVVEVAYQPDTAAGALVGVRITLGAGEYEVPKLTVRLPAPDGVPGTRMADP